MITPVLVIVVAIAVIFLVNAYHPFIKVSVEGVALIAGGLFSTYLGWALGMILVASGVIACIPQLAAYF